VFVHQIVECCSFRSLELGELLRSVGSTPTLCTVSLQGIKESLEVMLYRLEVQLYVAGEHQVLVGGWRPAPKSKLVSAFQSPAQSMPCYVRRRTTVCRKAIIKVLVLGEILRCALLWQSASHGLL
jgi:hypothetical protein